MTLHKKYVIELIKDYKRIVLHHKTLEREYDGYLNAQEITDMPKGSGISDPIQQVINKIEIEKKELEQEIKTVNDWLEFLTDIERFVVEQSLIAEKYYYEITEIWHSKCGEHRARGFWKRKLDRAVMKIVRHTDNPRKAQKEKSPD